jgi:hypothetical protein
VWRPTDTARRVRARRQSAEQVATGEILAERRDQSQVRGEDVAGRTWRFAVVGAIAPVEAATARAITVWGSSASQARQALLSTGGSAWR